MNPQRDEKTIESMLGLIESPEIRRRIEHALTSDRIHTDRVITAKEAGDILGQTERTVFNMANDGLLKRVKFPGRKIGAGFLESSVIELLARSVEGGAAA